MRTSHASKLSNAYPRMLRLPGASHRLSRSTALSKTPVQGLSTSQGHVLSTSVAVRSATGIEQQSVQLGAANIRRLYTDYAIYKGRAAMCVKFIAPTVKMISPDSAQVERPGVMLLEFAESVGLRKYDWTNKATIALSVTELATIINFPMSLKGDVNLFHDPNKGTAREGSITKSLKINKNQDGTLYFSLSINSGPARRSVGVMVSADEYTVMSILCQYAIPRLLCIDELLKPQIATTSREAPSEYDGGEQELF